MKLTKKMLVAAASLLWICTYMVLASAEARSEEAKSVAPLVQSAKFYPLFSERPDKSGKIYRRPGTASSSLPLRMPAASANSAGQLTGRKNVENYSLGQRMSASHVRTSAVKSAAYTGKPDKSDADSMLLSLFDEQEAAN